MKKIVIFFKLFGETTISLLRVLKNKSYLVKNKIPKNYGDKIFILGNGPSLNENLSNDIELLKNNDTFCVNSFCFTDYFNAIKPKYYIFLDPRYFIKKNTDEKFLKLQEDVIESLIKNVTWNMKIFIPKQTDMKNQWSELQKQNHNIEIIYFNTNPAYGFTSIKHFLFKRNLAMPRGQNVLIGAIYLSINMAYKNIYLLGADHSWIKDLRVNSKNQLLLVDKHFYSEENRLFYKDTASTELWKMHEILKIWAITFQMYRELELYARKSRVDVINLTKESYIDSFRKEDIKCLI